MKFKAIIAAAACICLGLSVQSCINQEYKPYYQAIVTLEPQTDGITLQLNDSVSLNATNLKAQAYNKVVRALVNYSYLADKIDPLASSYDVTVHAIDTIRTKTASVDLGIDNDDKYGSDKIEIINDWVTVGEDGYLNLRVRILTAYPTAKHYVYLVHDDIASEPNSYVLHHDAGGDNIGQYYDTIIAFDLNELCPEDRSPVTLHLSWPGFEKNRSADCVLTFRKK